MLVICAYLSAMAGVTALCYVFRRRTADEEVVEGCSPKSEPLNSGNTSQSTDNSKAIEIRKANPLTPEVEAKIQEVLEFVNTPEEELLDPLLAKHDQLIEESSSLPRSMRSVDCGQNKKDPSEVMDDIKQSQAKVEAWISELGKVINPEESSPTASPPSTSVVKYNHLSLAADARKKVNDDRVAKVKEETARRRNVLNNRMEANKRHEAEREKEREKEKERERVREEERKTARKRWSSSPDNGTGILYKREVIDVPRKRAHGESANSGGSVKAKHSKTAEAGKTAASTNDEHRGTRRTSAVKEDQGGTSRSRPGRTAATHRPHESDAEEKEVVSRTSSRLDVKVKGTTRAAGSVYSPRGTSVTPVKQMARSPSTGRSRSPVPSSRIPVMVNSRARPPVVRPAEREPRVPKTREKVVPPVVIQKPKKSIRITTQTPHPSQRSNHPVAAPTPTVSHVASIVYETTSHHEGFFQGEDIAQSLEIPKLNIIDVKETHSSIFQGVTEIPSDLGTKATRVARSGPIRLDRDNPLSKSKSQSIATLRAPLLQTRPSRDGQAMAVSKTVELPEGTDNNVTVYFAVTMPRHPNSNSSWNGSDERLDSDHTITLDGVANGCNDNIDTDDHSDDGIFPDELESCYPEQNDVEDDLCYEPSIGGEFDSCDEG